MAMNIFGTSERLPALIEATRRFVDELCIPREDAVYEHDAAALDQSLAELRPLARASGLYTPQLPVSLGGWA